MSTRTYGGRTLAHIESTARAATPGPWLLQTDSCDCGGDYPCSHGSYPYEILAPARQVEHYPTLQPGVLEAARLANFPEAVDATMADAEHMTTSDPTTVLALTAHIAALESALWEATGIILECAEHEQTIGDETGCDAGNPDGGGIYPCDHCIAIQGAAALREKAQRLSALLEEADDAK